MNKETIIKTKTATESRSRGEIKPLEKKEVKTFTDECPAPYTEQAANNEDLFLQALLGEI